MAIRLMHIFAVLLVFAPMAVAADVPETLTPEAQQFQMWFDEASAEFGVPVEVLQAIAFVESRWNHLVPEAEPRHEHDIEGRKGADFDAPLAQNQHQPASYGIMGLRDDAWFGHSLRRAAELIGRTPDDLKREARLNIRGAAAYLAELSRGKSADSPLEQWEDVVAAYSGIPQHDVAEVHTYDIFNSIRLGRSSDRHRVRQQDVDLEMIYGRERLDVLSAPRLTIDVPVTPGGERVAPNSDDYGPARWDPAASCNYTAGRSESITHVAIHITQGSYAGTISWFKNCDSNVSAHYVIRSSDGQVTQMVREKDTAYHVAYHNSYSIGIEHEGYASDCAWYTNALFNSSAALVQDITGSGYGIRREGTYDASSGWDTELSRSSSWKIKGHTNFPTTKSCPGICWDWPRFRALVIGPDLFGMKMYNTGTNSTEVHAMAHKYYNSWKLHTGTPMHKTNRNSYAFGLGDYNRDGDADLIVIKMNNTGSGKTEVHILSGRSGFESWLLNKATPLGQTNRDAWAFAIGDHDADGRADVYAIKMNNTGSGKTEVHILSGASDYQKWLLNVATPLGQTTRSVFAFAVGDHDRDRKTDLYAIKMNNTGSGKTEVHIVSASSNYGSWIVNTATPLHQTTADKWTFAVGDYNRDTVHDVFAINTQGGSGKTEAHILSGASKYQSWLAQRATAQGQVSLNEWWFDVP